MCCETNKFLCERLVLFAVSTVMIHSRSRCKHTRNKASNLPHYLSMLQQYKLRAASLNENKNSAVNCKRQGRCKQSYKEHTRVTPQYSRTFQYFGCQKSSSGTCNVFLCQQKSHLCPCTLSLLVSTCSMATVWFLVHYYQLHCIPLHFIHRYGVFHQVQTIWTALSIYWYDLLALRSLLAASVV